MNKTPDELAFYYQDTGDSTELLKRFYPYIMKWHALIVRSKLDLHNEEIREFLCLYIREKEIIQCLRKRAKYHTDAAIRKARSVLNYIQKAYKDYEKTRPGQPNYPYDDVYFELVEIFLYLAQKYQYKGRSFEIFLQEWFKYVLKKKYIDRKIFGYKDEDKVPYKDMYYSGDLAPIEAALTKKKEDHPYCLEYDEYGNLNNILWLNGVVCGDLYKDLTFSERFILVKKFQDGLSSKEIAQLTGFHHQYIARKVRELRDKFRMMRLNGEIKWIR